MGQNL